MVTQTQFSSHQAFVLLVIMEYSGKLSVLTVLTDSNSAGNFIDQDTMNHLNISIQQLHQPCKIQAIDRAPIRGGTIAYHTQPLSLQIGTLQKEYIKLFSQYLPNAKDPVILGLPWLEQDNPFISWSNKPLTRWSPYCHAHGLRNPVISLSATSFESPNNHVSVPISEGDVQQR